MTGDNNHVNLSGHPLNHLVGGIHRRNVIIHVADVRALPEHEFQNIAG